MRAADVSENVKPVFNVTMNNIEVHHPEKDWLISMIGFFK
jgi:hypothetical protein